MLNMHEQITIKTLKKQGKRNVEIAATLGCHRNTVAEILSREELKEQQTRNKLSVFSPYHEIIQEYLDKEYSRVRIWEILSETHNLTVSYDALRKYVRDHCQGRKPAYVVQMVEPGEEAEVDFGYGGIITTRSGERKKFWIFVMTLSYSRQSFFGICFDQSVQTFIQMHQAAFAYFGGVPKRVKIDNLKAGVVKNRRYDLEYNEQYLASALHSGYMIVACTPRQPQQKGKVERGVGYVKGNFLVGREFEDENDLERQLKNWMIHKANQRIHGTTRQIPYEVFESKEKAALQPLPQEPYGVYTSVERTVQSNCHISLGNVYYSVPHKYVGQRVEVRTEGTMIRIYTSNEQIASHSKSTAIGTYVTNTAHYPPYKVYSHSRYQAKCEQQMQAIGRHAHQFFEHAVTNDPKGWARSVRSIFGLADVYGTAVVEAALQRASAYGVTKGSIIKRICEEGLYECEVDVPMNKDRSRQGSITHGIAHILKRLGRHDSPSEYVRDLSYYQERLSL